MTISKDIDISVVKKMMDLKPGKIPAHLKVKDAVRTGEEFDPNSYFSALTHLSMKPGYTLDYIYNYIDGGYGGGPRLYARLISDPPIRSFCKNDERGKNDPLSFLIADGTPDSFFQLALFCRLAHQFYFFWYRNITIIASSADMERITTKEEGVEYLAPFSDAQVEAARNMSTDPCVEFADTTVAVTCCIFSMWGGFFRIKDTFQRNPPHLFVGSNELSRVKYSCGIVF